MHTKHVIIYDNLNSFRESEIIINSQSSIPINTSEEAIKVFDFFKNNISDKLFHEIAKQFIEYEEKRYFQNRERILK